MKPYEWQVPAVNRHSEILSSPHRPLFHLNVSKTGRGKTMHILFALRQLKRPVFVVCPKSMVTEWKNYATKLDLDLLGCINYEYIRYHKTHTFGRWLRKDFIWDLPKECIILFDEVHYCSGQISKTSRLLKGAVDGKFQSVGLSATVADSPLKMKTVGYALGLHNYHGWRYWSFAYNCRPGTFGGTEFFGEKHEKEDAVRRMMEPVRERIVAVDFPEDFPRVQNMTVSVDIASSAALDTAYMKELKEKEEGDRKLPITKLLRARQKAEFLKIPSIVQMAKDLVEEGNSVVAFFNFKESLDAFIKGYNPAKGFPIPVIRGGQSPQARKEAIDLFQTNQARVIAVMVQAGGQSISLHDTDGNYPRVSLICPSFSAVELIQALGRIHRASGKSFAINKLIFAAKSVETRIKEQVDAKIQRIEALNDSDLLTPEEQKINMATKTKTTKETPDHSQRGHSKYSPSGLKPKKACPGYESDNTGPPHPVTEEGTMLHEILDGWSEDTGFDPHPHLTQEQRDLVELCLEYKQELVSDMEGELINLREPRLKYLQGTEFEQAGNIDELLMCLDEGIATVCDWKFGYSKVDDAKENLQGKGYALAVFESYPEIEFIKVCFFQPRLGSKGKTEHIFVREDDLEPIKEEILSIIRECEKPDSEKKYNPSERNCKYCLNRGKCPAMINSAVEVAKKAGADVPDIDFSNPGDPKVLGVLLGLANWMEAWAKGVKQSAKRWYKEEGIEPEGFMVTHRKGVRSLSELPSVYELLKDRVPVEEFLECCSIKVPDLEKKYAQNSPEKSAKKDFDTLLREAGFLKEGAETLSFRQK